LQHRTSS